MFDISNVSFETLAFYKASFPIGLQTITSRRLDSTKLKTPLEL
jgi:hypothetical protein